MAKSNFARELAINIIANIIVIIIFAVIGILFGDDISKFLGLPKAIWDNLVYIVVSLISIVLIVRIFQIRRNIKKANRRFVWVAHKRPRNVYGQISLKHFDVLWRALYGNVFRSSNPYVFVEGPFCLMCDVKLLSKTIGFPWSLGKANLALSFMWKKLFETSPVYI